MLSDIDVVRSQAADLGLKVPCIVLRECSFFHVFFVISQGPGSRFLNCQFHAGPHFFFEIWVKGKTLVFIALRNTATSFDSPQFDQETNTTQKRKLLVLFFGIPAWQLPVPGASGGR